VLLTTDNYLDLRLQDFLDRLATGERAPGGGSAAALTIAFAASLVAMVARCAPASWADARGVAAQALAIRDRATDLARRDADVWQAALTALEESGAGEGDDRRDRELERVLDLAASAPLEIAALGADVAELAVTAAERCEGAYRADAAAAAGLAAGGARAAAHLVEVNLTVREGDLRLARARASEQAAFEAADRVLAAAE
jgi:methenyltetrahydrofolate cyclohydrolase